MIVVKNVTINKDIGIKIFYIPSNYTKTILKYNPEFDSYKEVGVSIGYNVTITNLTDNEIKISVGMEGAFPIVLPYINYIKIENKFVGDGIFVVSATTRNKEIIDIVNSKVDLILFLSAKY